MLGLLYQVWWISLDHCILLQVMSRCGRSKLSKNGVMCLHWVHGIETTHAFDHTKFEQRMLPCSASCVMTYVPIFNISGLGSGENKSQLERVPRKLVGLHQSLHGLCHATSIGFCRLNQCISPIFGDLCRRFYAINISIFKLFHLCVSSYWGCTCSVSWGYHGLYIHPWKVMQMVLWMCTPHIPIQLRTNNLDVDFFFIKVQPQTFVCNPSRQFEISNV